MTAEEFLNTPDDDPVLRELVRGVVTERPLRGAYISGICVQLVVRIGQFVKEHGLGLTVGANCGFTLERDPDTVRAPSGAFVSYDRLPGGKALKGYFSGAPDLTVEMVSPTDRPADMRARVAEYLRAGAKLVWVVCPETREVQIHKPDGKGFVVDESGILDGDPVLPGLRIPIRDIFAE